MMKTSTQLMKTPTQPTKPSFYNVCVQKSFNSQKLQEIANMSGVPFAVIVAMCQGEEAVGRSNAEKVLKAFSWYTHGNWTLENVVVKLSDRGVQHG